MVAQRPWASTPVAAALGVAAAAAGGTAVALAPSVDVLAALVAVCFTVLAFLDLPAAVAVFIVATFVEQVPGAGAGLTAVKGMGAVVVLAWALGRGRERRLQMLTGLPALVVAAGALLFAWAFLSAAWASDPHTALSTALRLGQGVVLVVVLATCLSTRAALKAGVAAFVGGACLSAVLGLAGVGKTPAATVAAATRIGGGLGDPNYLAAVLIAGLFFALALRRTLERPSARLVALAVPALLLVALLKTESRGAVVAFGSCAVAGALAGGRLRRQVLGVTAAVLVGGSIYLGFFASSTARRIAHFGGSGSGRTELWSVAWRIFENHPLGGVGSGNFPTVESSYAPTIGRNLSKPYLEVTTHEVVHNTYLHVLVELGVIGFVALAVVVAGSLLAGRVAMRCFEAARDSELAVLAGGLVLGAIGLLVAFAFLSAQYEKQLWVTIGLLLAAGRIGAARSAETSSAR